MQRVSGSNWNRCSDAKRRKSLAPCPPFRLTMKPRIRGRQGELRPRPSAPASGLTAIPRAVCQPPPCARSKIRGVGRTKERRALVARRGGEADFGGERGQGSRGRADGKGREIDKCLPRYPPLARPLPCNSRLQASLVNFAAVEASGESGLLRPWLLPCCHGAGYHTDHTPVMSLHVHYNGEAMSGALSPSDETVFLPCNESHPLAHFLSLVSVKAGVPSLVGSSPRTDPLIRMIHWRDNPVAGGATPLREVEALQIHPRLHYGGPPRTVECSIPA